MNNQTIIVCDEAGKPTGEYILKEIGHTGQGKRHLAITVLLYNKKGRVLLQKRKHKRFDGVWDLTGATDLWYAGKQETFEEATKRCLKNEYGIDNVEVKKIGAFNYFAPDGPGCEREHCALMVGEYNGEVNLNPEVGYGYEWVEKEKFLQDISQNPQKYSQWAIEGAKILQNLTF